ncbi:MAG: S41 family peptidase [Eubacteriales bacterium]|nr:S41 family peptidase [Eubacteriales bacterium]
MKEKLLRSFSYLLVAFAAAVLTLAVTQRRGPDSKLEELEALIDQRFIGEAQMDELRDAAAEAMVKATGDRWSYYIPADEYESYSERMANAYVGIGITIQPEEGEGYLILSVTPGSPAEESGILPGDLLVEVEGQKVAQLDSEAVRALVRGEEGTTVSLRVMRMGDVLGKNVERRKVKTQVATYEMLENNIGYVKIANFDTRCAQETIAAIDSLVAAGAEKLIFDVRNNPGGYAHELVDVLDYLLPEGDLFRSLSYDGKETVDTSDPDCLGLPMAVLVNGSSYSAAEFFAAAIQEYDAGVVVGEKTTGKGYFQTTIRMSDGSAVALSVGKYFTPQGVSLADTGVTPDILSPVDEETAQSIYSNTLPTPQDPQIQSALRALEE